jgi:arsenate reductase
LRILFLCTHNSARSQMAEALTRHYGGDKVEVYSAGTEPGRVHPLAARVMAESGIDISEARSKSLNEFLGEIFDYVITVCDRANETCPVFPGDPERIHWSFEDPSAVEGTEGERLKAFRDIRNLLNMRIQNWLLAVAR